MPSDAQQRIDSAQESSDVVGVLPTRMKDLRVGQEMEDEILSQRNIDLWMMIGCVHVSSICSPMDEFGGAGVHVSQALVNSLKCSLSGASERSFKVSSRRFERGVEKTPRVWWE